MGKRGPRRQPTRLKLLRGNPGRRKLPKSEPRPDGELPNCPAHLTAAARQAWEQFAQELTAARIATSTDAVALELLAAAYARYLEAADNVAKFGAVWVEKGAGKIPKFAYSPYWAVMNHEWKHVKQMLAEFGMTPSSRSSVESVRPPAAGGKFAAYKGGA